MLEPPKPFYWIFAARKTALQAAAHAMGVAKVGDGVPLTITYEPQQPEHGEKRDAEVHVLAAAATADEAQPPPAKKTGRKAAVK